MKEFTYGGEKYQIDASGIIFNGGDIDEINKIILIDKDIPEKFYEGIAVHEIEERKLLNKGHSYVYSHNEAQKKEAEFYEKKYGEGNGLKTLEEEENVILTPRRTVPKKTKILSEETEEVLSSSAKPLIETRYVKEVIFDDKHYTINNSERLIGTLVDVYDKGGVVYIDRDVPDRLHEGLALNELLTRKNLKKGMGWSAGHTEANKVELEFLKTKYGQTDGQEIFDDEDKFLNWKLASQRKDLKSGGHKVIYEKDEILPK